MYSPGESCWHGLLAVKQNKSLDLLAICAVKTTTFPEVLTVLSIILIFWLPSAATPNKALAVTKQTIHLQIIIFLTVEWRSLTIS
jgi:hypothetical protein